MKKNINLLKFDKKKCHLHYIRSFVCRKGRITKGQKNALNRHWKLMGVEFSEQTLDYTKIFECQAPVVLEIGFGMGASLVMMAKSRPWYNFLGIEVYIPGVGACLATAHKQGVENLRVMCHDAVEVLYKMIPDASLSIVQLFFPDPWHKTRHNKRRIVQISFANLVKRKLKHGGILHIATDCHLYAEHILDVMSSIDGYKNQSINNKYLSCLKLRPITKFEQRGHILGHTISDFLFEKTE